jgi:hypothetical protein
VEEPPIMDFGNGHTAACHFPLETPVGITVPAVPVASSSPAASAAPAPAAS